MTYNDIVTTYNVKNSQIAERYGIPMRTLQQWAKGTRVPPEWAVKLLERALEADEKER